MALRACTAATKSSSARRVSQAPAAAPATAVRPPPCGRPALVRGDPLSPLPVTERGVRLDQGHRVPGQRIEELLTAERQAARGRQALRPGVRPVRASSRTADASSSAVAASSPVLERSLAARAGEASAASPAASARSASSAGYPTSR